MAHIIIVVLASSLFASFAEGMKWPVTANGRVTCDGQPMPYVFLHLMDKNFLIDKKMGSAKTDGNGRFTVKGSGGGWFNGKPDPYIRVEYSYSGFFGKMKIRDVFRILRNGRSQVKSYSSHINFGTINFASIHCRAYVQFYSALRDFGVRAMTALPYDTLNIITKAILTAGTPYATIDVVRIPQKYSTLTYLTAKHEFAHTVRHSYDGSFAHFLEDVIKYHYAQQHRCSDKTNYGFAFNEGWAEFWAGQCSGSYENPTDYEIEGNVAKGLRSLRNKCHGYSGDAQMIQVLKKNKGKIHSFSSFNYYHKLLYSCAL